MTSFCVMGLHSLMGSFFKTSEFRSQLQEQIIARDKAQGRTKVEKFKN